MEIKMKYSELLGILSQAFDLLEERYREDIVVLSIYDAGDDAVNAARKKLYNTKMAKDYIKRLLAQSEQFVRSI